MACYVQLNFQRPLDVGGGTEFAVYCNGLNEANGRYRYQATGEAATKISRWIPCWNGEYPGFGAGLFGAEYAWGDPYIRNPGGGFGTGIFGAGDFGDQNYWHYWDSETEGLKFRDGNYTFSLRQRDALGNMDDGAGETEQAEDLASTPEPPRNLRLTAATATTISLSWSETEDISHPP